MHPGVHLSNFRWSAPELLDGSSEKLTTESDVYALSMVIVEVRYLVSCRFGFLSS